ncbi:MAG: hypothetical protein R2847_10900 [Bacteroidia bacterium]
MGANTRGSGNIRVTNNLGETTTSAIAITVNYNETNVVSGGNYYQPDLINDNGTNGYTLGLQHHLQPMTRPL